MPLPPPNYGVASLWFRCVGDPEEMAVTLGFHDTKTVYDPPNIIAQAIYEAFVGTGKFILNTALSNVYSVVRCDVRITRELEEPVQEGTYVQSYTGSRSTQPPPSNCSLFVRKNTGFVGRRNKGRMYFPAGLLAATEVTPIGGLDTVSVVPTLNTRLAATYAALNTSLLQPVIIHSVAPFTPTPVTSMTVQPVIATQRRRMRPG